MRRASAALCVFVLVLIPFSVVAGPVTTFQGGKTEEIVELKAPAFTEYLYISIPADCLVLNATMDVSSVLPDANCSDCPEGVQVFLDDGLLWEFNGADYGALGRQDAFIYERKEVAMKFGIEGGTNGTSVRLLKNAKVLNATMEVDCNGPGGFLPLINLTGEVWGDFFGRSVSGAGDMNQDGYDDMIVGATGNDAGAFLGGRVYIHFGGKNLDRVPEAVFTGDTFARELGVSVSDAGDLNNDGYDDVIVGARGAGIGGEAYAYYGGASINKNPDVTFVPSDTSGALGSSVSSAGDVNGDGYDDIIAGAGSSGSVTRVYIYLGGASMDGTADIVLEQEEAQDGFGVPVSGAGDVNGDGYGDVMVAAWDNDIGGHDSGRVHLYFGGSSMDTTTDIYFNGTAVDDFFGYSISAAGDVNNDGYDDVIVSAPYNDSDGNNSGRAYIFFGGRNMDSTPDVILTGAAPAKGFGFSVSGAGDLNKDGYDDVVVGVSDSYYEQPGGAYVYFGGANMDNTADMAFKSTNASERFGVPVSGAGDVNNDGSNEIIIGAGSANEGRGEAYIYSPVKRTIGIYEPNITVNSTPVWSQAGYFNDSAKTSSFAGILAEYLQKAPISGSDEFGNDFVDVPISIGAKSDGNITLARLNIAYTYKKPGLDLTDELNGYIFGHKEEKDADGNITVPIKVVSRTPGRVKLSNLNIVLDEAPRLVQDIPDVRLAEDTARDDLIDLRGYFKDDCDAQAKLNLSIVSATNQSFVKVGILDNRYLSADATGGPGNWTGEAAVIVRCADTLNHSRTSNEFRIIVYNINDAPVITSMPPKVAVAGTEYSYQVVAEDGDDDALLFELSRKPVNMTIDSTTGLIEWIPSAGGAYEVNIEVSDGQVRNHQDYIIIVPNRPPRITNTTVPEALVGVAFVYDIPAVSDDGRELSYKLVNQTEGMTIDASTGRLGWTPTAVGDFSVSVNMSDSKTSIIYDFIIHVLKGNKAPVFSSNPVNSSAFGFKYIYEARATDEDGDALTYSLETGPDGMTIDASTGRINWTPNSSGDFNVRIKISDGKGGEAFQEFTVRVVANVRPVVELLKPREGQTLRGKAEVLGNVTKGTFDVVKVQVRIDSGDWMDASGNSTWQLIIDTAKLKNGKHTLQARAYDGFGYSETVNRAVKVDNPTAGGGFIPGFESLPALVAMAVCLFIFRKQYSGRLR